MNRTIPFALAGVATAAPLNFTITGTDAGTGDPMMNSVNAIDTLELDGGRTVSGSDLIGITLTSFTDTTGARILNSLGAGIPANGSRAAVLEDGLLDTGFINLDAFGATFNTPVVNGAGFDAVLVDRGFSANDTFDLTINGQTLTFTGGAFVNNNFGDGAVDSDDSGGTGAPSVASLAALETTAFPGPVLGESGTFPVVGIDFSAFGVAAGATVTSFSYSGGVGTDPVLVAGVPIPEPASAGLAATGLIGLLARRRRA